MPPSTCNASPAPAALTLSHRFPHSGGILVSPDFTDARFAPREVIAGKDARTLRRDLPAMLQVEFRATFAGAPMKRAKLRGLKRNVPVVLANVGTIEDLDDLTRTLDDGEFATLEWVAWFDTCRLMAPLGYLPPAEYEEQFDHLTTAPVMAGALN